MKGVVRQRSMRGGGSMERWGEAAGRSGQGRLGQAGVLVVVGNLYERKQDRRTNPVWRSKEITKFHTFWSVKKKHQKRFNEHQTCLKYYNEEKCADQKTRNKVIA